MKMIGFALAAVTALTLAPATANAKNEKVEGKVTSILYSCNMNFRATGKSIYIGLGWSNIKGHGTISCYDLLHGTTEIIPIKVKLKGPGAGLGVTGLVLSGAVAGVGVEKGPEELIGHYAAVRANAAAVVGVGGAVALRISKGGITVDVSAQAETGLGAGLDLLSVEIEQDGEKRIEAADVEASAPQAAPQESVVVESRSMPARSEKANIVYLQEGQPLQILDAKGHVIQTIYLKNK